MQPIKSEITQYGIKYTYRIKLRGRNSLSISANIVVVIQKDNKSNIFRIITVYPDKGKG